MAQRNGIGWGFVAIALAAVAWAGVVLQLALSIRLALAHGKSALDGVIAFAGYFTVLTNILVALVASAACSAGSNRVVRRLDTSLVRGCATTAILTVGIGYHLLLRHVWSPQGWQWVADGVLHYVVPLGALVWWVVSPPRARLSAASPLQWALYPAAYVVYALLRGAWLGTYPYPFIDVTQLGYARAIVNACGLLVAFVALGYVVRAVAALRNRRQHGDGVIDAHTG